MRVKVYLGDAVYIEVERGMLKLTTEDGIRVSNTVFLERYVLEAFEEYVKEHREELTE